MNQPLIFQGVSFGKAMELAAAIASEVLSVVGTQESRKRTSSHSSGTGNPPNGTFRIEWFKVGGWKTSLTKWNLVLGGSSQDL